MKPILHVLDVKAPQANWATMTTAATTSTGATTWRASGSTARQAAASRFHAHGQTAS